MKGAWDEIELQRCVDGELNRAERRDLLRRLDETTNGWRELALLFMENQVVGSACSEFAFRQDRVVENVPQAPVREVKPAIAWPLVAASLVLGVVFTIASRGIWEQPAPPTLVGHPEGGLTSQPSTIENVRAADPVRHVAAASQGFGQTSSAERTQLQPVMELSLVANGGSEAISVPVFSSEQMGTVWPSHGSLIPQEVLSQLERNGLQLDRETRLIVCPLDDGSSVLIPAESVRVQYAVQ